MNILDKINSPKDLKKLNREDLISLCDEMRSFIIESVSKTGGHLSSNLGVIELTVALHYVFDCPNDNGTLVIKLIPIKFLRVEKK
jgi:1-deoxy-D-xylulose-5-phosphate synthase